MAWLVVAAVAGGCGSSSPKPDPTTVHRLVAELNSLCRSKASGDSTQARLAQLGKALEHAAAYLPAGRALDDAIKERRALEHEIFRPSASDPHLRIAHETQAENDRFRRIELKIYKPTKRWDCCRA